MQSASPNPRIRPFKDLSKDPRLVVETALAVLLTTVVFVQTERIATQAAQQNRELMIQSATAADTLAHSAEILDNLRFVRQTVIDDSPIMPFSALDLSGVALRGLDFGCSDERIEPRMPSPYVGGTYVGQRCADFSDSDLSDADLQGAQLNGAIFQEADLSSANLALTNLNEAWLTSTDLSAAQLGYASMRETRFHSANLVAADLRRADLADADFTGADLSYSDLRDANLEGAVLEGVVCVGTQWPAGFDPPAGCAES